MNSRMKKMTFYLVGPIQYVEDYMTWRQEMSNFLDELGHAAEFPWGEVYHGKEMKGIFSLWLKKMKVDDWLARVRKYMRAQVIRYDINALLKSDGIIFYLPKGTKTVGSYGEQTLAYFLKKWKGKRFQGKKIFVIVENEPKELSYWLIGCSDRVFFKMEDFKEYFKKHFNRNSKKRKRKKKK